MFSYPFFFYLADYNSLNPDPGPGSANSEIDSETVEFPGFLHQRHATPPDIRDPLPGDDSGLLPVDGSDGVQEDSAGAILIIYF